ncbi:MAG: histidine phosphatase family protein, partial [Muribaculaceae bacterium]|nr:histidine phosphatase family protein [Muribaculaceae bacterium]
TYPYTDVEPPAQTPPPAGYVPFHLEHYGRHGSRWLIGANDYLTPVKNLEKAERAGKLTPLGKETLEALRKIEKDSHGRLGELTDKGALQHQAIGRRMAQIYPQLFTDSSHVDAKSTVVIRCILSMLNGLQGIREVAPNVSTTSDASHADMYFMNYDDKPAWKIKDKAEETVLKEYREKHKLSDNYLSRLVTDPQFARDSVAPDMMPYLYWVLASSQGISGEPWLLDKVFTADEAREAWRYDNGMWVLHCIDSPLTERRMPYTQRMLMKNIIESTDTAINSTRPSVNLRYGHDGILINFITLMELNDLGKEFASIEEAEAAGLRSYDLIPMAGNIQLVFYRPEATDNKRNKMSGKSSKEDDILVKVLLNEREMRLPAVPVTGPYYKWSDLRDYYLKKIAPYMEN